MFASGAFKMIAGDKRGCFPARGALFKVRKQLVATFFFAPLRAGHASGGFKWVCAPVLDPCRCFYAVAHFAQAYVHCFMLLLRRHWRIAIFVNHFTVVLLGARLVQ